MTPGVLRPGVGKHFVQTSPGRARRADENEELPLSVTQWRAFGDKFVVVESEPGGSEGEGGGVNVNVGVDIVIELPI